VLSTAGCLTFMELSPEGCIRSKEYQHDFMSVFLFQNANKTGSDRTVKVTKAC
jgi:hypothetical protein